MMLICYSFVQLQLDLNNWATNVTTIISNIIALVKNKRMMNGDGKLVYCIDVVNICLSMCLYNNYIKSVGQRVYANRTLVGLYAS